MSHSNYWSELLKTPSMQCVVLQLMQQENTAIHLAKNLHQKNQHTYILCSQMAKFNALHQNHSHNIETFSSTRDLEEKMLSWLTRFSNGIVIHSAAVGDYEISDYSNQDRKISSNQSELIIKLRPAPKILPQLKKKAPLSKVISFKAASPDISIEEMIEIAKCNPKKQLRFGLCKSIGQTDQNIALVLAERVLKFERRTDAIEGLLSLVNSWMLLDNQ